MIVQLTMQFLCLKINSNIYEANSPKLHIVNSIKGGGQMIWKGIAFGLMVISLGAGILLALTLPPWALITILAFLLIVLGFLLICNK